MAQVTIQGSTTPSTFLPRGERITVERTAFVDKMIRRGFVVVVRTHDDPPAEHPAEVIAQPDTVVDAQPPAEDEHQDDEHEESDAVPEPSDG